MKQKLPRMQKVEVRPLTLRLVVDVFYTPKRPNMAPARRPFTPKGKDHLPIPVFQVRTVSFWGCSDLEGKRKHHLLACSFLKKISRFLNKRVMGIKQLKGF